MILGDRTEGKAKERGEIKLHALFLAGATECYRGGGGTTAAMRSSW